MEVSQAEEYPIKLYGPISNWRMPWIYGLIFFFIETYFDIFLYHLSLYLFSAGIITYIYEWLGWGKISKSGLIIRYGILNLNKISIDWNDLEKIGIKTKTYHRISAGKFGAVYDTKGYDIDYLKIKFKEEIPVKILYKSKYSSIQMLFGQKIEPDESERSIIISKSPECGLNAFLQVAKSFVPVTSEVDDVEVTIFKRKLFNLFDEVLLFLPFGIWGMFN